MFLNFKFTKQVTPIVARFFVCSKCDKVETVKGFCYPSDRLNPSGGREAAVTARTRVGWKKFRECGEILFGKRFSLRMKGKVYKSYVRSTMLYGSKTWCLRENKVAILRRAERPILRAMCGVKLVDKREYRRADGHARFEGSSR